MRTNSGAESDRIFFRSSCHPGTPPTWTLEPPDTLRFSCPNGDSDIMRVKLDERLKEAPTCSCTNNPVNMGFPEYTESTKKLILTCFYCNKRIGEYTVIGIEKLGKGR